MIRVEKWSLFPPAIFVLFSFLKNTHTHTKKPVGFVCLGMHFDAIFWCTMLCMLR